jgi:hypothetical protein
MKGLEYMNCTVVLSSVTYAIKAQKILSGENIAAELTKSSAVKAVRGCGYGIKFNCENSDKVLKLLEEHGVKTLGMVSEG